MRIFAYVNEHVLVACLSRSQHQLFLTGILIGSAKVAYFNFTSKGRSWSEVRGLILEDKNCLFNSVALPIMIISFKFTLNTLTFSLMPE